MHAAWTLEPIGRFGTRVGGERGTALRGQTHDLVLLVLGLVNTQTGVRDAGADPPAIDFHHHGLGNHRGPGFQPATPVLGDVLVTLFDEFGSDLVSQGCSTWFARLTFVGRCWAVDALRTFDFTWPASPSGSLISLVQKNE